VVRAYRAGQLAGLAEGEEAGPERPPRRLTVRAPALQRSVLAILHSVPRLCGWWRTRWSGATIALELHRRRGLEGSGETGRRWLQELDWGWKRAKLRAKDEDPQRVEKLARIRRACAQLRAGAALFFADELEISLLPKGGYQWMPQGAQGEVRTPGTTEKRYRAGALEVTTGPLSHWVWYSKVTGLFLDLLQTLDRAYPARTFTRLSVGGTTLRVTRQRRYASGWRPIPASRCSTCRPTAPERIPLSGPWAMSTTSVRGTTHASGCGLWSKTSNRICRSMAPGPMRSPPSTIPRR
jgi:hypothetical protein